MVAVVLDTLIQVVLLIPVLLVLSAVGAGGTAGTVVLALVSFGTVWLYFPLFEWLWSGRTPGKRAQRIRVIRTDGQPVDFPVVLVRNLVRIVDVYLLPFLAVISMILTARAQRLGDLAAGTMVVRERSIPAVMPVELGEPDAPPILGLDTSQLTEREYSLIRSFLARRDSLDPQARQQLAAQLVASVHGRLGEQSMAIGLPNEQFLQAVARLYRARFADQERQP